MRQTVADDKPLAAGEVPVTPSAEQWRAMSPEAREQFVLEATAALQRQVELAPEGRPHSIAKMRTASVLGEFFERIGRRIYLASDLPVLYPQEPAFAPDLIAVQDVEDPGDADTRLAWDVVEEGRGLDLALEILYAGDRNKDLVGNVARYARLQIPEYFVYDRLKQRLFGYHLPVPETRRYQAIAPRSGRLRSQVLGLDLGVVDGRLRFFFGEAQVPDSRELIERLDALMSARERQLEEEIAARQDAERRRLEAERMVEDAERQRQEAERRQQDAEQRADLEATARAEAERRADEEAKARAELEAELAALRARFGR